MSTFHQTHLTRCRVSLFWFLVGILLFTVFAGCQKPDTVELKDTANKQEVPVTIENAPPEQALARVGDEAISKQEFRDAFMDLYKAPEDVETKEDVLESVLQRVLMKNYLYLEAKNRNLEVNPVFWLEWEVKTYFWLAQYFTKREGHKLVIDSAIISNLVPADAVAYHLHQISIDDLALAQEWVSMLRIEGADFEKLAREFSTDPAAAKGGELERDQVIALGNLWGDDILRKLASVEVGQISNPIPTEMGYTIFRIDERRPLYPAERAQIENYKKRDLQEEMGRSYLKAVKERYPFVIDEGNLAQFLEGGSADLILATVGDEEIQGRHLEYYFSEMVHSSRRLNRQSPVREWLAAINSLSTRLSIYAEAKSQGLLEEEVVKENLSRVKKYSLSETMSDLIRAESSVDDQAVFERYKKRMTAGESGIYSLTGVIIKDEEAARKLIEGVNSGIDFDKAVNNLGSVEILEKISGTYKEAEFSKEMILALELTPVGSVSDPISVNNGFGVFSVDGKRRGDAPTFDQVFVRVSEELKNIKSSEILDKTVVLLNRTNPPQYVYEREEIGDMLFKWYEEQRAIKAVDPHGKPLGH